MTILNFSNSSSYAFLEFKEMAFINKFINSEGRVTVVGSSYSYIYLLSSKSPIPNLINIYLIILYSFSYSVNIWFHFVRRVISAFVSFV